MGYCTHFSLEVRDPNTGSKLEGAFLASTMADLHFQSEGASYALGTHGQAEESCKWYDHEKDMREFSKRYPSFLFVLSGEGEEAGDIWKEYFLNGKCQIEKAKIAIADFDKTQLK